MQITYAIYEELYQQQITYALYEELYQTAKHTHTYTHTHTTHTHTTKQNKFRIIKYKDMQRSF